MATMDATKDAPDGAKREEVKLTTEEATIPVADPPAASASAPETIVPDETKPAKANPVEATPIDQKPIEDKPVESKPVETPAVETPPVEAKAPPVEVEAPPVEVEVETKVVETKTFETTSTEASPVETKVMETKVITTKAVEAPPAEAKASEDKAVEVPPVETKVVETKITETKAVEAVPAESEPVEATAVDVKPVETQPVESATVETKPAEVVEDFSDPDEDDLDDLDDLDDMLDDFSTVKLDTKKPDEKTIPGKSEASKGAADGKKPEAEDAFSEEEFAKQLQAGMADLLGELEQSPDMQAQFEDIFKQIAASDGTADPAVPSTSTDPAPQASAEDASFQDTIRKTMERMQTSGDQATAAAASGGGDDFMSEMLKQLSSGDLGGLGGDGSEEEFSKMLMGMMEQLTNKEILYEPMKELDEKFPAWLTKNRSSTPKEDLKRYNEQQAVVREIVAKFEEKTYSDSNAADREFIVDKMQKMQAAGSPPSDLVGDMSTAQEALNPGDEACNPQ
ncbi:Peroxisome chaperone and import receptor [Neonectria punicea]|uniref:Peroxisome chaperone and import receptor n=1 Tax=Neonectria punicea TaxID=979145 RepID=A0ABR1GN03_9HYPO